MIPEFELIERLKKIIPRRMQGNIPIGHDAGMFSVLKGDLVFTSDVIVDGVDFVCGKLAPEWIGRKALAVNLSDIAAMGAEPLSFVCSIGLPPAVKAEWVEKVYKGIVKLAEQYKILFLGGDVSNSRTLFISIALIGKAGAIPPLRNGAKANDRIGVTGRLGGSILSHHYRFEPRLAESAFIMKFRPSAMMDVSDGLVQDLGHILKNSRVGARIDLAEIPVSGDALKLAKGDRGKALKHALSDGEDFELLFTMPEEKAGKLERGWKRKFPGTSLSWIGRIERKSGMRWTEGGKGCQAPALDQKGFVHFA